MVKVGVLGLGNLGTALAKVFLENKHSVIGWSLEQEVAQEINTKHTNSKFLKGIKVKGLNATTDIQKVMQVDVLFICIPSIYIKETVKPYLKKVPNKTIIVNCAKGLIGTKTCSEMVSSLFSKNTVITISGPSVANEFSKRLPAKVVIAGKETKALKLVQKLLHTPYFATTLSKDVKGVELGGILKNIYALGLGVIEGKIKPADNFRGIYITKALEEMAFFAKQYGADPKTMYKVSGIGDLIATALSKHSHNRNYGLQFLTCDTLDKPEGCNTLEVVLKLSKKMKCSLPIAESLHKVIMRKKDVTELIEVLLHESNHSS